MSWQIERTRTLLQKLLAKPKKGGAGPRPAAVLAAIKMGIAYLPVWQPRANAPGELLRKRAALVAQGVRPAAVLRNAKALLRLLAKSNPASTTQAANVSLMQAGLIVCRFGHGLGASKKASTAAATQGPQVR